ncbi:MAG: SEL1-like repeat protein [Chloroflexi bacterium]|nr:SEL1-like repeat protein [Chloroflexota bacterium]
MKKRALFLFAVLISMSTLSVAHAQITSAGSYTRKVAPRPATPAAPAQAARPGAPAGVVQSAPVDPAKVKAGKEAAERKRLEWQIKRANDGVPYAQYDLALRYLTGDYVEKNLETARKWLEKAAKSGHAPATKKLAEVKKLQEEAARQAAERQLLLGK